MDNRFLTYSTKWIEFYVIHEAFKIIKTVYIDE